MENHTLSTLVLAENFLYNSLLSVLHSTTHHPLLMPKPTYISLFVGRNCPLHCQHCSFWKKKDKTILTYQKGKAIVDMLYDWLGPFRLNISGGEPLLIKDMLSIVTYAEQKGIRCGMASNGYLINENVAQVIVHSGLSNINISLDSLNPSQHDQIRGTKGAFKKTIHAIELIQKFRSTKKPLIYINSVLSGENEENLVPLAIWVKDQHLDGINFQPIISDRTFGNTHAKKQWYKKNPLWPKHIYSVLNALQNLKQQGYPINNLESDEIDILKTYFMYPERPLLQTCKIALRNFYIDHYGNVTICQLFPPIGNIFKKHPEDIWKSYQANKIRKRILSCHNDCQLLLCNRPHHIKRIVQSFLRFFMQSEKNDK